MRNRAQDFEEPLGLGVKIEIEQDVDIGANAVAQGFKVHDEIAQHGAVNIEIGLVRTTETRPPSPRILLPFINKDVRLAGLEALVANFSADRIDAIEIGDRWLVVGGMINPPGRAV